MSMSGPRSDKYPWWQSLRYRAVGWTLLPLSLILIVAIGATVLALQTVMKQLAENQSQVRVQLMADQVTSELEKYQLAFEVLSQRTYDFTELPSSDSETPFGVDAYLLDEIVASGKIIILDFSGRVIYTHPANPSILGQDHSQQPYFQSWNIDAKTPTYFDVVEEPDTGQPIVGLSVPIDGYRESGGLLVGQFYLNANPPSPFLSPLQAASGQLDGYGYLADRNGQIIYHTDSSQQGQDFSTKPAILQLQQSTQSNAFTSTPIDEGTNRDREVIAYAPIPTTAWGLVISTPWNRVMQPIERAVTFVGVILAFGLIGLLLIVFWAVGGISQPLENLVAQARRVAAGTYDSQVNLSNITEIREAGLAFNHMVNQLDSYRTGLQEYVAAVTDTQEEERKRIARDLHDGTVQSLIAIGQRIELARDSLDELPTDESKAQLTELRNMVTDTIASVRQFSRDLRPLALEDLGLVPALQFLMNRLAQDEGISAELETEGQAEGLSPDLETAIYRLVQESLSNIRKHAQATVVTVTVRFLPRQTILEIRDNGVGFKVPESTTDLARNGSFGLLGMEERANLFGGDISLESAINQGSIIRVILPHKQLPRRKQDMA